MTTITENDLKDLKDLINKRFDLLEKQQQEIKAEQKEIQNDQKEIRKDITEIKISVATLKEGQNGINKRIDNLDFIARTVIGGVVLALLAGLTKLLFPDLAT